jgi:hypothetical protein
MVAVLLLVTPFSGLAVNAILHCILARMVPGGAHVRIQFVAFGLGMVLTVAMLASLLWQYSFSFADRVGYLLLHSLIYGCFGFGLFNLINANVSSLRVRMLKEYLAVDRAPLSDADMYQRYSMHEMLSARLERLKSGGQIYIRDSRYYAHAGSVVLVGRLFAGLRRLLLPG